MGWVIIACRHNAEGAHSSPQGSYLVGKSVLGESLKTMCGLSGEVAIDDPDVAESAALLADSASLVADSAATLRPLQDHAKKSVVWLT